MVMNGSEPTPLTSGPPVPPGTAAAGTAPAPLRSLRAFLVDLDGVVYTGNTPLPGAAAFFQFLRAGGRRFQCITNNSTLTAEQYSAKLRGMGIDVAPEQVLTSAQATAVYLRERLGTGARVMAIGEHGLVRALLAEGLRLVWREPSVVVCGLDRRLTYERLKAACLAIRAGAQFVATNPDLSLPAEDGFLPGNGAALAYIQAATGVPPVVIGKPAATMLQVAMELLGSVPAETAIIGDGLHTDMLAGQRAGVVKILVLTGVARREDLPAAPARPDHVFTNLVELQESLAHG
jgi:4-nitrophenyl phosphatase